MSPRWEPNPNIRRGRTVVYTIHAHLVFTPKYRRGPFTDEILTRCEEVMRAVCADFGTELVQFNGEPDHVHLLVHYPPRRSPCPGWSAPSRACPPGGYGWGHLPAEGWGRVPRSHPQVPLGRALLVSLVLRRLVRRSAAVHHQGVHRAAETSALTCGPEQSREAIPLGRERPRFLARSR